MISLIVADDHTIFREGLKQMLAEESDFRIVGEATNGDDLLAQLRSLTCDIVLLDLTMPGRSGIALLREVAGTAKWRVIVLSMHEEDQYIIEALKAGAAGYVTKNSALDQLILAIRKVVKGELFVSAAASQSLIRQARSAMIYPVMVLIIASGVVALITIFLLPMFVSLLNDVASNAALPLPSRILMGFSRFMTVMGWWLVPLVAIGLPILLWRFYKTEAGKSLLDRIILRVPAFGSLALKVDTTRFARTLSTLLDAGVARVGSSPSTRQ